MNLPNKPRLIASTYNPISNTRMDSFLVDFPTVLLPELRTHRIITQTANYEHLELIDFNLSANCLHPDTLISIEYNKEKLSGKKIKISNLYERFIKGQHSNLLLRCLNEETDKIQTTKIKNIWKTNKKECFKITLTNNNTLICSKQHRFYTDSGYKTLEDINVKLINGRTVWDKNNLKIATNGVTYDYDFFIKERNKDKSLTKICLEQGYNFGSASRFCVKNKIRFRKFLLLNETFEYKNKEWLIDKISLGLFSKDIAKLCNSTIDRVKKSISKLGLKGNKKKFSGENTWNTGLKYKITSESGIEGHKQGALKRIKVKDLSNKKEFLEKRKNFTSTFLKQKLKESDFKYKCPLTLRNVNLEVHHIIPVEKDRELCFKEDNFIIINKAVHKWIHSNKLEDQLATWIKEEKDLTLFIKEYDNDSKPFINFNDVVNTKRGLYAKYFNIKSIEYFGEIECYDIEVEGDFKNFVADNIIVHNSARAIGYKKYLKKILDNPFIPIWTKEKKGMSGELLSKREAQLANEFWTSNLEELGEETSFEGEYLHLKDMGWQTLLDNYNNLIRLGVHKQNANRLLAPFAYTTCIVTATNWENFFSLRSPKYYYECVDMYDEVVEEMYFKSRKEYCEYFTNQGYQLKNVYIGDCTYGNKRPKKILSEFTEEDWQSINESHTQPEFQMIIEMMYDLYRESNPKISKYHIPFEDEIEELIQTSINNGLDMSTVYDRDAENLDEEYTKLMMKISASMAAKLSFDNQFKDESIETHLKRAKKLAEDKHFEVFSHQAVAMTEEEYKEEFVSKRTIYKGDEKESITEYGKCFNLNGFISQRYILENSF